MNKRLLSAALVALLACLSVPGVASAHVLKVDGSIGAVLHINPDDNPTTDGPTDYIMSFDDDNGQFSLPKCDCTVSIINNGQTIATEPLVNSSNEVSENHYTFTEPGVYDMQFTGKPKQSGGFQPFTLNYEVRVTGGQAGARSFPVLLWVGIGMGMLLVLLAAYALNYDSDEAAIAMNKEHQ
ncbi:MAG TPA: hypothetical protein VHB72_02695 [Candidatus Saccharimonadales bacterium]|nr:hypothetical protein [Candidatus Saccharimonadales bacterium]